MHRYERDSSCGKQELWGLHVLYLVQQDWTINKSLGMDGSTLKGKLVKDILKHCVRNQIA